MEEKLNRCREESALEREKAVAALSKQVDTLQSINRELRAQNVETKCEQERMQTLHTAEIATLAQERNKSKQNEWQTRIESFGGFCLEVLADFCLLYETNISWDGEHASAHRKTSML